MAGKINIFFQLWEIIFRRHKEAIAFIILQSFFFTFITSRTFIYLNTLGIIPDRLLLNQNIRGVHVHHLAFGIIFLTIAGYLALNFRSKKAASYIAVLYGVGLGLAYDEFGMWLHLKDDYWVRQSYDAVAVIFVFLVNVIYLKNIWRKIFSLAVKLNNTTFRRLLRNIMDKNL